MNKSNLQALLREKGEEPPRKWTMLELRQRLIELDPDLANPTSTEDRKTELQKWVSKINKARAKKALLVELCQTDHLFVLSFACLLEWFGAVWQHDAQQTPRHAVEQEETDASVFRCKCMFGDAYNLLAASFWPTQV